MLFRSKIPVQRGILATIYCDLTQTVTNDALYDLYTDYYKDAPFVVVNKPGVLPEVKHVRGSNFCHIGWVIDERLNRLVLISALDNLIKGAAGQAIQNMNILFGLEQTTGLLTPGWYL